jgi:allantoinase
MLMTDVQSRLETRWPAGVRLPLVLTFEHQSGEGAPPRPGDRPNANNFGQMEYGARRGIWNILELLDRFGIKVTIFSTGMSYGFERVRTASRERELGIVRRTKKAIADTCGVDIKGWRCPDYRISAQTFDVLAGEGFTYDSSMLNDDLPYQLNCESGPLIEIPFTTSTQDKAYVAFPYPVRGGPGGLAHVWNNEFDMLYREAESAPRFMILSLQTWASGRPTPLRTLKHFLERITAHNDIQFARCSEIAGWCAPASDGRN